MKKLFIEIDTENAAFESVLPLGYAENPEVVRILREIADRIENGESFFKVQDINGNTVGSIYEEA